MTPEQAAEALDVARAAFTLLAVVGMLLVVTLGLVAAKALR